MWIVGLPCSANHVSFHCSLYMPRKDCWTYWVVGNFSVFYSNFVFQAHLEGTCATELQILHVGGGAASGADGGRVAVARMGKQLFLPSMLAESGDAGSPSSGMPLVAPSLGVCGFSCSAPYLGIDDGVLGLPPQIDWLASRMTSQGKKWLQRRRWPCLSVGRFGANAIAGFLIRKSYRSVMFWS